MQCECDPLTECIAPCCSLNVIPGDVIVMGSDGLFDNCPAEEIVDLLPDSDEGVAASAERIASAARAHAGAHSLFLLAASSSRYLVERHRIIPPFDLT